MATYTTETFVIKTPSDKLLKLMETIREHKRTIREETKNSEPLFTLHA